MQMQKIVVLLLLLDNILYPFNAELFSMTYGSVVMQLVQDYEDVDTVNSELERMGYNIGIRLIDEFLAKSNTVSCHNFRETADTIAKVAFKMFLGITGVVTDVSENEQQFSLQFATNPITNFVELPPEYENLSYCNLLCGVIRGALDMVQMRVSCEISKDPLKGHDLLEIKIKLLELLTESVPADE